MIDSRWSAEVINNARHHDAYNPYKEINVDEPRFKSRLGRNHVRFQQGKHDDEENTGEHVCDKFCHTLKIHQSNAIDVNSLQKESAIQDLTGWGKPQPLRLGYIHASMAATLTLRVLLNGSAIFVQAQLRHRCFASCYRLGYKIASYLASLALRHFRLGAYSPFEVVFVTTFLRMTASIKVQDDCE